MARKRETKAGLKREINALRHENQTLFKVNAGLGTRVKSSDENLSRTEAALKEQTELRGNAEREAARRRDDLWYVRLVVHESNFKIDDLQKKLDDLVYRGTDPTVKIVAEFASERLQEVKKGLIYVLQSTRSDDTRASERVADRQPAPSTVKPIEVGPDKVTDKVK